MTCCALDALSAYKYGGKSTFRRFANFILEYSGFREKYLKVCLPELKLTIQQILSRGTLVSEQDKLLKKFEGFLQEEVGVVFNEYPSPVVSTIDIPFRLLKSKAVSAFGTDEFARAIDLTIKSAGVPNEEYFTYIGILWKDYRCLGVHEMSLKKGSVVYDSIFPLREPYYSSVSERLDDKFSESIPKLTIPALFMVETLENCITNFEVYCNEKSLDLRDLRKQLVQNL